MPPETLLKVFGPFEIPFSGTGLKKHVSDDEIALFWENASVRPFKKKHGCYVFALKAGKGHTPWYVGQTTKGFQQEIFQIHKLNKYNDVLWSGKKGKPVMFFVCLPGSPKKIPKQVIDEIEVFLIQSAVVKNPEVKNAKNTKNLPKWGIAGVLRSGKGKTSDNAAVFKSMMGL